MYDVGEDLSGISGKTIGCFGPIPIPVRGHLFDPEMGQLVARAAMARGNDQYFSLHRYEKQRTYQYRLGHAIHAC